METCVLRSDHLKSFFLVEEMKSYLSEFAKVVRTKKHFFFIFHGKLWIYGDGILQAK